MRELTKKEIELNNKGIKKRESNLEKINRSVFMLEEQIKFGNIKRVYDEELRKFNDKIRPLNNQVEDEQLSKRLKELTADRKINQEVIDNLNSQIKDGVAEKTPLGV